MAILMTAFLLAAPITALAKKGEKNFRRGIDFERAQQWEKAAQEYALAVAARPSDTEYLLHYKRAIFNASQVYMQKGRALAEQGDYIGAYNAFRTSYGYDGVNELAANEMARMLRLQREKEGLDPATGARVSPTAYRGGANGHAPSGPEVDSGPPQQFRNINYSGELEPFIRQLADELNLNVVFDANFSQVKRTINLKLKDVTAARALDYIFMAYGLFFQKLDRRTILVADQSKRPVYQQLVLRTFYLNNIPTDEARAMIQAALPANSGRQPQVVMNKTTNSITVRDTPENMRIITDLIQSIDKDRSEVVMEVAIYEVSNSDLLQVGNQLGGAATLGNLGGLQPGSVLWGGARSVIPPGPNAVVAPLSTGVGLLIPASSLAFLQVKDNTKLVFSTQVHAFDDEKSETRIGQKVPVQTASVYNGLTTTPTQGSNVNNNNVFGNGYPVIQYEDTGLVLDFTPKVYPNQDVQVKMNIETKDVGASDANSLTPTFTQRKISGVARIPNGKTMMIASVGQNRESEGRQGLPLLGLIPILGRFFTSPTRRNLQSDVVITMTPRVLRAPRITPEDEKERRSGSMQTPTQESLEAMLKDADREDQLARAVIQGRKLPTNTSAQLPPPPGEDVSYVPAPKALAGAVTASQGPETNASTTSNSVPQALSIALKLTDASAPGIIASRGEEPPLPPGTPPGVKASSSTELPSAAVAPAPAESVAELVLFPDQQEAKVGEKRRVMVFMKTDAPVGLATATLRFDPKVMAVRAVSQGMLTTDKIAAPTVTQSIDPSGVLLVSVAPAAGAAPLSGAGLLLIIEVEALAVGEGSLVFDTSKVHLIATDGRTVRAKVTESRLRVTQ
jgi:general secretion pathway protein D